MRLIIAAALLCAATASAETLDRGSLEAFVDGAVQTAMEDHRIPGVVVSVVHRGEVVLEKAYGYARPKERVPADAARTLWRVASVTKPFNSTALMQLVEQGRVDLDAPLTRYLPDLTFELPHGVPTVRDLITHSAGFEDSYFGHFYALDEASDHALGDYVARYQPAQVRAPGDRVVYSNYGIAVAGLIIETVSGMPYPDYIEQHVLRPLGMHRSTMRDWTGEARDGYLPVELEPDLGHSSTWKNGAFVPPRWAWVHRGMMPAGGLLATGREMTYFMRAHLGDGAGILSPDTLARMHTPAISNHPDVAANAHGWWAGNVWGWATLEHPGLILGFLSNLLLVPELELGVFVSTNGMPGRPLIMALPRRIVGQFFERRIELPAPGNADALAEFDGRYLAMRRGYTTIDKLMGDSARVSHNAQGYLVVAVGAGVERYVPLQDDVFINVNTGDTIAFTRDADGNAAQMHHRSNIFERISIWRSDKAPGVAGMAVGFALVLWLLALGMTRHRDDAESTALRAAKWLANLTALAWLGFAVTLMITVSGVYQPTARHFARFPAGADWGWIILGPVAAVLTLALLAYLVPAWRDRGWYWTRRASYTLLALSSAALALALWDWNLLGLRVL